MALLQRNTTLNPVAIEDLAYAARTGAIALRHPLCMSWARLVTTAAYELRRRGGRPAICTLCIGVGQGIAMVIGRG